MTMISVLGDPDATFQTTANIVSVNNNLVTYKGVLVAVVGGILTTETHTHTGLDGIFAATPAVGSNSVFIYDSLTGEPKPVHRIGDQRSAAIPPAISVGTPCPILAHVTVLPLTEAVLGRSVFVHT